MEACVCLCCRDGLKTLQRTSYQACDVWSSSRVIVNIFFRCALENSKLMSLHLRQNLVEEHKRWSVKQLSN